MAKTRKQIHYIYRADCETLGSIEYVDVPATDPDDACYLARRVLDAMYGESGWRISSLTIIGTVVGS